MPQCQGGDPFRIGGGDPGGNIHSLCAAFERVEGDRDIFRLPDFEGDDFEAERASRRLDVANRQHIFGRQ